MRPDVRHACRGGSVKVELHRDQSTFGEREAFPSGVILREVRSPALMRKNTHEAKAPERRGNPVAPPPDDPIRRQLRDVLDEERFYSPVHVVITHRRPQPPAVPQRVAAPHGSASTPP